MATKEVLDQAQTAFIRARIQLLQSKPFYAYLVMKMPLVWMDEVGGGLSMTDGESIMVNPAAFIKLTKEQQVTCLVHEAYHCAAGHLTRRGSRDCERWNIAADAVLDNALEADGFKMDGEHEKSRVELWSRVRINGKGAKREDFSGMNAEQVYELLPQSMSQPQSGSGKGNSGAGPQAPNGCGGQGDDEHSGCCFTEPKADQRGQLEAKWKQAVIEAGQMAGTGAGAWQELVKAAMPKPPFHLKLFEYLERGMGGESTWNNLNRRFIWRGMYLPSDTKIVMGRVACFVDTSGSMSSGALTAQLNMAFGYIRAFREQHPCEMDVVQCDYDVAEGAGYTHYPQYQDLPSTFEVVGRGGTAFDPPFKLMRERKIEPKVAIYFTDGYGSIQEEKKPPYPVLWVVIGGDKGFAPPWGDVCYVAQT